MNPVILAVGGGKGGTGKSTLAVSLAARLTDSGHDVILADLDLGGANLHTLLEIHDTDRSLVQFIYQPGRIKDLHDCLVPTAMGGLHLLPGTGFIPGVANMEFARKQKLIRALKKLRCDYVVCDLGAGSSFNVVDFFLIADRGILLLTAEATAILNGYEFMKNCIFRKISRYFAKEQAVLQIVNSYKNGWENGSTGSVGEMIDKVRPDFPEAAKQMEELCRAFTPALLLNREKLKNDSLGAKLDALSRKYLNIRIDYLGALPPEPALQSGILSFLKNGAGTPFEMKLQEVASFFCKIGNRQYLSGLEYRENR